MLDKGGAPKHEKELLKKGLCPLKRLGMVGI